MKCIQRGKGRILKVSNTLAKSMMETQGYHYVERKAHKVQQEQLRNGTNEGKSVEEKQDGN